MKKPLITALILAASVSAFGQQRPDTNQLKKNLETLQQAAAIIQSRHDIAIADGIAALNIIQQIAQSDFAALDAERRKAVPVKKGVKQP